MFEKEGDKLKETIEYQKPVNQVILRTLADIDYELKLAEEKEAIKTSELEAAAAEVARLKDMRTQAVQLGIK